MKKIIIWLSLALLGLNTFGMEEQDQQSRKRKRVESSEIGEATSENKKIRSTETVDSEETSSIDQLPAEVLAHILSFVGTYRNPCDALRELANARLVCKDFCAIAQSSGVLGPIINKISEHSNGTQIIQDFFSLANEHKNCGAVSALLKRGASADAKQKWAFHRNTPLIAASWDGNTALVKCFINQKSCLKKRNEFGFRAIDLTTKENSDCALVLIENGALRCSDSEETDFFTAVILGDSEKVGAVIEGIDTNMCDRWGTTPLMYACNNGDLHLVKLLLEHGALVNDKNKEHLTPLSYAVRRGNTEVIQLLLDNGAEVDSVNKNDQTPLMIAAAYNRKEAVEFLLAHHAKINESNLSGLSALGYAVKYCCGSVFRLLIKNNAEVRRAPAEMGFSLRQKSPLLVMAAKRGHKKMVKLLLALGSSNSEPDRKDEALLKAVKNNQVATVRLLLEAGADTNAFNRGIASLHIAAENGFKKIAKLLIKYGANINILSTSDRTPLLLATIHGQDEMVEVLLKAGAAADASSDNIDSWHSLLGRTDDFGLTNLSPLVVGMTRTGGMASLLMNHGANVNRRDHEGYTPLMRCCTVFKPNLSQCKLLIDKGANINERLNSGDTALMLLCGQSHSANKKLFKLLVQSGAEIDAVNNSGETALMKAASLGNEKIVKLLLKHGARDDLIDTYWQTALDKATTNGHANIVKLLNAQKSEN